MKRVTLDITGIKCDAEGCDYHSNEQIDDYSEWLDRPCPLCGESLLTQADLEAVTEMNAAIELLNSVAGEMSEGVAKGEVNASLRMNGTGEITVKRIGVEIYD